LPHYYKGEKLLKLYDGDLAVEKITNQWYQEIKDIWEEVYMEQLKLVDRGLTTSMWRGAGV
jgi:hypothetical protein